MGHRAQATTDHNKQYVIKPARRAGPANGSYTRYGPAPTFTWQLPGSGGTPSPARLGTDERGAAS